MSHVPVCAPFVEMSYLFTDFKLVLQLMDGLDILWYKLRLCHWPYLSGHASGGISHDHGALAIYLWP